MGLVAIAQELEGYRVGRRQGFPRSTTKRSRVATKRLWGAYSSESCPALHPCRCCGLSVGPRGRKRVAGDDSLLGQGVNR